MNGSDSRFALLVQTDPDARVTIFDGYDALAGSSEGTFNFQLKRGVYTVRVELGGQTSQMIVHVSENTAINLSPLLYSPAPIAGAATTHEYYHDPSQSLSTHQTFHRPYLGAGGWLFVFVRLSSAKSPRSGDIAEGMSLADANGQVLLSFDEPDTTARDDSSGWVALSTPITPGFYRLCFKDREAGLQVLPNRSTQVFVTYHGWPRLEQMRVFFRDLGIPFDAADPNARAVDMALLGLQNGLKSIGSTLPQRQRTDLLHGKFENPMLGLIGAHWLLADPKVEDIYIQDVLRNLNHLLGSIPDVVALEVLAGKRPNWSRAPVVHACATPPMIRHAVEILVREAPELIVPGSLFESILPVLQLDSPWTRWTSTQQVQPGGFNVRVVSAIADTPDQSAGSAQLDWLEAALLTASIRGEKVEQNAREMAKRYLVAEKHVKNALTRVIQSVYRPPISFTLKERFLAVESARTVEAKIHLWTMQGAILYDEPPPHEPLTFGSMLVSAEKDVFFDGGVGKVRFPALWEKGLLACVPWSRFPGDIDETGFLKQVLPDPAGNGYLCFGLKWEYDAASTPRGAVGLAPDGPKTGVSHPYCVAVNVRPPWTGARDGLQGALRTFCLPRQSSFDEFAEGNLLIARLDGSFRIRFRAAARFLMARAPALRQQAWPEARATHTVPCNATFHASGSFEVSVQRIIDGEGKPVLRFSILRSVDSKFRPVCMISVEPPVEGWLIWTSDQLRQVAADPNGALSSEAQELVSDFYEAVRVRSYFESLTTAAPLEQHWYTAEREQGEDFSQALARTLEQSYGGDLRNIVESGAATEPKPLMQMDLAVVPDNMPVLQKAVTGDVDLTAASDRVSFQGTLVRSMLNARDVPIVLVDERGTDVHAGYGRIVLFNATRQSGLIAAARVDARLQAGSGPVRFSVPAALLSFALTNASSEFLEIGVGPLARRWMSSLDRQHWDAAIRGIREQAQADTWDALVDLKLHWDLDLRRLVKPKVKPDDRLFPAVRREVRLLLPALYFDGSARVHDDLDSAAMRAYSTLPNTDAVPMAAGLADLFAWETQLTTTLARELTALSNASLAQAPSAFESMAVNLASSLERSPYLERAPQAAEATRTILLMAALCTTMDTPVRVSADLSLTVYPSGTMVSGPAAVRSRNPLARVIAHARLSSNVEDAHPGQVLVMKAGA